MITGTRKHGEIDSGCPINWSHPLAVGLELMASVIPGVGGSIWYDLTGQNNGQLNNMDPAKDWVGGRDYGSGALEFTDDGASEVEFTTFPGVTGNGMRTCAISFKQTVVPSTSNDCILTTGTASDKSAWEMLLKPDGSISLHQFGTGNSYVSSAGVVEVGSWMRVVATHGDQTGTNWGRLYINGVEVASRELLITTGTANLKIGSQGTFPAAVDVPNALINEVMAYRRALTAAEVALDYSEWLEGYPNLLRRMLSIGQYGDKVVGGGGGGTVNPLVMGSVNLLRGKVA